MKPFDKLIGFLQFDDEDEYESDDMFREPAPRNNTFDENPVKSTEVVANSPSIFSQNAEKKSAANNTQKHRKAVANNMEVCRVEPTSIQDGRKITDYLLENKVVFLDLEGIDMNLAQRIIDFVSGATYAIDGTLQKVSNFTFVIAPPAVSVSGDFRDTVDGENSVTF